MQIHTFIANSATEAVEQIRAELGPAAVVLSVRKLPRNGFDRLLKQEQIEVVAGIEAASSAPALLDSASPVALDPIAELREEIRQLRQQVSASPSLRPVEGVTQERKPSAIAHILNQTGLLPAFSEQVVQSIPGIERLQLNEQIARVSDALRQRWNGEPVNNMASVHVFVGLPGSGKSTVLCKMLAQTSLVEGQPATVYQLDAHAVNASPQPSVYSEIVGAYFERTVPLNFERREESVYVDVPGIPLNNGKALDRLKGLISEFGIPEIHLVLNGAYESNHLLEQVRFFAPLGLTDLIITHLDEESRWGKLWNLILGTELSIRNLSSGQNVPGDFFPATPELILSRQFRGK